MVAHDAGTVLGAFELETGQTLANPFDLFRVLAGLSRTIAPQPGAP